MVVCWKIVSISLFSEKEGREENQERFREMEKAFGERGEGEERGEERDCDKCLSMSRQVPRKECHVL